MSPIHQQLRARRKQLDLKQKDMQLRTGMTRQQYHRLEGGGNPRLSTLELTAAGLDLALMLIPKEKLQEVQSILNARQWSVAEPPAEGAGMRSNNPWEGLLSEPDDE